MGLVYPQAVKIRAAGVNIKRYQNMGYSIPMKKAALSVHLRDGRDLVPDTNAYFDVVLDDVPKHSHQYLWYNCDCCGELNYMIICDYTRRHPDPNAPIYCRKCLLTTLNSGPLSKNWNPNLTQEERESNRKYPEYTAFIKRVMERDNYTCQCCGKKSEADIVVHHLNGYGWDIEHRTDDENGITLCKKCHQNFHSLYGNRNVTKEMFEEWIGHRVELTKYTGEIYSLPKVYCIEDDILYDSRFDAAEKIGCNPVSIWQVCQKKYYTYCGKHYVYYEEYLKLSKKDIKVLLSKGRTSIYYKDRQVICKNTGELYKGTSYAAKAIGYKHSENINNSCNGVQKSAGQINGMSLQWTWHRDFIQLPFSEQLEIAEQNKETLIEGSFLYNLLKDNNKT